MSQRYSANPYANGNGAASGFQYGQSAYAPVSHASNEEHEQHNDAMVDALRGKVSFLKDVSMKIGQETRDSLALMTDMNDEYDKQNNLMKRTKNRLLAAANAQSWGWFHLFIFILIVFIIFVLVFIIK
ncbi:hypothetical protein PYCC9005_000329 [Savitreella phatthalungensis]